MINLENSKTKENLMRGFAGESQARNRYTFAASIAKKEGYAILDNLFTYTADQEKAHAWEFMKALKDFSGSNIQISTSYPAEVESSTLELLKSASKHEKSEANKIYPGFANTAKEEGFKVISDLFIKISSIESIHSSRFSQYATELENNTLFKKDVNIEWICTNCGYIYEGEEAPKDCPVCGHPQGYFMPFKNSTFE